MPYRFGDVLLVPLVFSDATQTKRRPVLVIFDSDDLDLLVVPITSHRPRIRQDITFADWKAAGLRLPSTARMSKLATIAKSTVLRHLGRLSDHDAQEARKTLRLFMGQLSDDIGSHRSTDG